jgi:hypothetical protein
MIILPAISERCVTVHFVVELRGPLMQNPEVRTHPRVGGSIGFAHGPPVGKQEEQMASSGTIQPLYGVIIRDKCKSANVDTLKAYRTVAYDLLKDYSGDDTKDLAAAVKELEEVIAKKK